MKTAFKIFGSVVLAYFVTIKIEALLFLSMSWLQIKGSLPIPNQLAVNHILFFVIFVILFSSLWSLFLREKSLKTSFIQSIQFKKTYVVCIVIFTLLSLLSTIGRIERYKKSYSLDDASHFIGDSIYENSQYHFRLTYPKGSVFANAHPESGFVTRFFIPDGQTIGNDQENIGIYIEQPAKDLEAEVKQIEDRFLKNGSVDIQKVQFGGQNGYRILMTSDYSAQKGTKELVYITVKNNIAYELMYFPVAKNVSSVDHVASSFEFTQ